MKMVLKFQQTKRTLLTFFFFFFVKLVHMDITMNNNQSDLSV